MNSLYENRNSAFDVEHSDYYYCEKLGHYLYKSHLELCEANHTVWE